MSYLYMYVANMQTTPVYGGIASSWHSNRQFWKIFYFVFSTLCPISLTLQNPLLQRDLSGVRMQVIHLQHVSNVYVFHMSFPLPVKWLEFLTTKMLTMQGGEHAKRTHKDIETWSNALGPWPYINSSKQPSRLSCNNFYQSSGKKGTPGPPVAGKLVVVERFHVRPSNLPQGRTQQIDVSCLEYTAYSSEEAFQDFPSNSKAQNRAGPKIFGVLV